MRRGGRLCPPFGSTISPKIFAFRLCVLQGGQGRPPLRTSRRHTAHLEGRIPGNSAIFTDKGRSYGALFPIYLNSFLTRYPINSTIDNWNSYSRPSGAGEPLGGLTYSAPDIRKLPNTVKRRCARNLWNLIR